MKKILINLSKTPQEIWEEKQKKCFEKIIDIYPPIIYSRYKENDIWEICKYYIFEKIIPELEKNKYKKLNIFIEVENIFNLQFLKYLMLEKNSITMKEIIVFVPCFNAKNKFFKWYKIYIK